VAAPHSPVAIGPYQVDPPVVLAPMAGITNVAFRRLCRTYGAGLYVCEMITSRALVERAVEMIVDENLADHIDMNFGCPVPKVTRKGGGAALPYKRRLFADIVAAAVRAAGKAGVPVTVKFRIGIDDDHHTFLDAGRIAEAEGAAAVALHARTAAQRYSGTADWAAIAKLKDAVTTIPVLGNGDIFCAQDALDMMARTGCDGVVVGRGCLGRPWLFRDLQAAFAGEPLPQGPDLGGVADVMHRHGRLLAEHMGEYKGVRDLRKHMAWYLRGFPVGSQLRQRLALVSGLAELADLLGELDQTAPFPAAAEGPRGRQGSPAKVVLPDGWLDDPDDAAVPAGAELMHSGG
jgi:nifR3 family TIM-barrel protein